MHNEGYCPSGGRLRRQPESTAAKALLSDRDPGLTGTMRFPTEAMTVQILGSIGGLARGVEWAGRKTVSKRKPLSPALSPPLVPRGEREKEEISSRLANMLGCYSAKGNALSV